MRLLPATTARHDTGIGISGITFMYFAPLDAQLIKKCMPSGNSPCLFQLIKAQSNRIKLHEINVIECSLYFLGNLGLGETR